MAGGQYRTPTLTQKIGAESSPVFSFEWVWHEWFNFHGPCCHFFPNCWWWQPWFVFHSVGSSIVTSLQVIQLKCTVIMTVCLFYLWPNCCALYQDSTSLIFNMIDIMTTLPNSSYVKARMITPRATRPRHHWKRRLNNNSILMTDTRTKRDWRGK